MSVRLPSVDFSSPSRPLASAARSATNPYPIPSRSVARSASGAASSTSPHAANADNGPASPAEVLSGSGFGGGGSGMTGSGLGASGGSPLSHSPAFDQTMSLFGDGSQPSSQDILGIDTQYPTYTPPPPAITRRSQASSSLSHTAVDGFSLQELENLIQSFRLDDQKGTVYWFHKLSLDQKLTVVFMQNLNCDVKVSNLKHELMSVESELSDIRGLCQRAWGPSKSQVKIFRALVRHFLVKPIPTYTALPSHVKNYVYSNADILHLGNYKTDPIVRVTVNGVINDLVIQMKSAFRKMIFQSCKSKTPLYSLAKTVLHNYHLTPVPQETPIALLGVLALMRKVADPLTKKANTPGSDTGFWKAVETAVEKAYGSNGNGDRNTTPAWKQWAEKLVAADKKKWPAVEDIPVPDAEQEIDRAFGISRDAQDNDIGVSGASADDSLAHPNATDATMAEQDNEDSEGEDENLDLAQMGPRLSSRMDM